MIVEERRDVGQACPSPASLAMTLDMATIILTENVAEYRRTIPQVVRPTDSVLEVGCAWGTTSRLLVETGARVVAVDTSDSILTARETYPHVEFHQADAFGVRTLLAFGPFTKAYVDLSGSRAPEAIMKLTRAYIVAFGLEAVVVKNTKLKRFAAQCRVWPDDA